MNKPYRNASFVEECKKPRMDSNKYEKCEFEGVIYQHECDIGKLVRDMRKLEKRMEKLEQGDSIKEGET